MRSSTVGQFEISSLNRQLEAIIRISESLAKMALLPFAMESHVDEALRLFQVSTLDASHSGTVSGEWVWLSDSALFDYY